MPDFEETSDSQLPATPALSPRQVDSAIDQNVLAKSPRGGRNRPLFLDPLRREVHVIGHTIALEVQEFVILQLLARRPYWPYSRKEVIDGAHREAYPVTDETLDVFVAALREKLGPFGDYVQTVPGFGLRFKE